MTSDLIEEQRKQIETLTAQVGVLRETLEFMWRDVPMNEYAFEKLEQALATTPESALSEMRRAERERVIELLKARFNYLADYDLDRMYKAIRAME